jgi:hypothetical protein
MKRVSFAPRAAGTERRGEITITHSLAEGTLVDGSRRGDGVWEILKGLGTSWRPMPSLGCLGLGQSRDKPAKTPRIEQAAAALRAAGWDVTTEVDDTAPGRPVAEQEADRAERAERRADYHAEVAGRAARQSGAAYRAEHAILDRIPAGQPVLKGHHSEARHRRDLGHADSLRQRGRDEANRASYHEDRAEAAERHQAHRESVPAIRRRIGRNEADERSWQRALDGKRDGRTMLDGDDGYKPAEGPYRERVEAALADVRAKLAYDRALITQAEDDGVKVWGPADFTRGDFARERGHWYQVERVNGKSVTVPHGNNDHLLPFVTRDQVRHAQGPSQWTRTVGYDRVTGRMSAAEVAAILAEADRREAEQAAGT